MLFVFISKLILNYGNKKNIFALYFIRKYVKLSFDELLFKPAVNSVGFLFCKKLNEKFGNTNFNCNLAKSKLINIMKSIELMVYIFANVQGFAKAKG